MRSASKKKKIFMVGRLGEQDGFIDNYLSDGFSEKSMTVADYLGDTLGLVDVLVVTPDEEYSVFMSPVQLLEE